MPDEGDIIITGVSINNEDDWLDSMLAQGYTPNNFDDGSGPQGGGGNPSDDEGLIKFFKDLVKSMLEVILNRQLKSADQVVEDEREIARGFDPLASVAVSHYTTSTGRSGTNWTMPDGTVYWDTNGNNKPDYMTKFNTDGHLYGSDGSGWQMIN